MLWKVALMSSLLEMAKKIDAQPILATSDLASFTRSNNNRDGGRRRMMIAEEEDITTQYKEKIRRR